MPYSLASINHSRSCVSALQLTWTKFCQWNFEQVDHKNNKITFLKIYTYLYGLCRVTDNQSYRQITTFREHMYPSTIIKHSNTTVHCLLINTITSYYRNGLYVHTMEYLMVQAWEYRRTDRQTDRQTHTRILLHGGRNKM